MNALLFADKLQLLQFELTEELPSVDLTYMYTSLSNLIQSGSNRLLYSDCCFKYEESHHRSVVEDGVKFTSRGIVSPSVSGLDITTYRHAGESLLRLVCLLLGGDLFSPEDIKNLLWIESVEVAGELLVPLDDKGSFLPCIVQPEHTVPWSAPIPFCST